MHTPACGRKVVSLSEVDDARWSGMITLAPFVTMPWTDGARHDIYVIEGSVSEAQREDHAAPPADYVAGTFISRDHPAVLRGGSRGATLFVYRDRDAIGGGSVTLPPSAQQWHAGRIDGMSAARLSDHHHRLMLVRWKPGTRARMHQHPWGEEIYVLEGELQDQRGRYPAGSWQRLQSHSGHAPFSEVDTLILLRNGHLRR